MSSHPAFDDLGRITGDCYRVSLITPRVLRVEYSPSGTFEDRPTTFALHRDLKGSRGEVDAVVRSEHGRLVVENRFFRLTYDGGPFTANGLRVEALGGVSNYHSVWRYDQDLSLPAHAAQRARGEVIRNLDGNLGGAARTVDEANGAIPLEPGVNSTLGYAVIDDSGSMVFDEHGTLGPRNAEPEAKDLYVFVAGHDHLAAVQDLFALSGPQPLLPKQALGNWWSRYHRYSEESYLELLDRFEAANIPLSVAVIDMDWHVTDVDPKYGSGWTGYTWNTDLFPDPERFQRILHERGLATTLNLHPADGVRAFEDAYPAMAEALGRPADGTPIEFDVNDPEFMRAYFEVLHGGLEKLGTDFWWIDWQSGPYSHVDGVDPLWVLNHGHFQHSVASGPDAHVGEDQRGLIFSRYAGPGSHRYPVGFSGDSIITWESLAFQPRFTAAAANIGYGWWSHDIGGHMGGYRDDELATRWVQFGVFSPILRLHSSNSPFTSKEPWLYGPAAENAQTQALRFRHRLVPYLHAMNRRAHMEGRCLVEPMYFSQSSQEAYRYLDQYMFGSQLLVAPIVRPAAPDTGMGSADVWLPEGRWVDIFTGVVYDGGRALTMHRPLESTPVLLKAGGILPLVAEGQSLDVRDDPDHLEILVAAGADGAFDLDEEILPDRSVTRRPGTWRTTHIGLSPQDHRVWVTSPRERTLTVRLLGFDPDVLLQDLRVQGAELLEARRDGEAVLVKIQHVGQGRTAELFSAGFATTDTHDPLPHVLRILHAAQIGFGLKEAIFDAVSARGAASLPELSVMGAAPHPWMPQRHDYDRPTPELISAVSEMFAVTS